MSKCAKNIKHLRLAHNWSQEALAKRTGVSRSTISALEQENFEPSIAFLLRISDLFSVDIDSFLKDDLAQNGFKNFSSNTNRLTVTVDLDNNEQIEFIPERAAAGYTLGYSDVEYIVGLPKFNLPYKLTGANRAFEIHGNSMVPIPSGSIVIGKYIEKIDQLKVGKRYIFLTKSDGITFKRLSLLSKSKGFLICSSDNASYEPFEMELGEILEIWEFHSFIGTESIYENDPLPQIQDSLNRIEHHLTFDKNG